MVVIMLQWRRYKWLTTSVELRETFAGLWWRLIRRWRCEFVGLKQGSKLDITLQTVFMASSGSGRYAQWREAQNIRSSG